MTEFDRLAGGVYPLDTQRDRLSEPLLDTDAAKLLRHLVCRKSNLGQRRWLRSGGTQAENATGRDEVPGLRQLFLAEMADELTEAQDRMLMLARRSVEERVATFLLTMARRQAEATGTRMEIVEIPMRWSDIADYLGTTAETTSRTLSLFRDRGIIRTGTRVEIGILDWAALEAVAAGA